MPQWKERQYGTPAAGNSAHAEERVTSPERAGDSAPTEEQRH
jgi:hypothetical protein